VDSMAELIQFMEAWEQVIAVLLPVAITMRLATWIVSMVKGAR